MRVALDTNSYVDYARGDARISSILENAEQVFVPLIVLAELRAGFLNGSRTADNERRLVQFLNLSGVHVLLPDENTTHHYARLFVQLRRQGTPIPTNDLWIAALVIQHELVLCARDKHFVHLPQLPRLS